ncbi:MAG: PTS phosphocarrier protein NPr [Enterobacteriaceae bacterium]
MTVRATVKVKNRLGMHARPAMKLFELVEQYQAEVMLYSDNGMQAEASSVIAMLMLNSAQGRQIDIEASGPDEREALLAVVSLFESGFDES